MRWVKKFLQYKKFVKANWFALLAFLIPVSVLGQGLPGVGVPGIGIGVGIPVNILADYPNPYANKAAAYRSVYLFKASEFGSLAGQPQAIRGIFFHDSIPQSAILQNFTIRMKAVNWDSLPLVIPDNDLQTVYWPRSYADHKGLNEHQLDVPFCWDGVSNFIVDICVQNPAGDVSANATIKCNIPDSGVYYSYHDWNNAGDPICAASQAVQPQRYDKRPLTSFSNIHGDSTDLRMYKISSPIDLVDVGSVNSVSVTFQNYSCTPLSGTQLGYKWNNNAPVIENYSGTINPGDFINYTFTTPLVASPATFSVLKVWTQHPVDHYPDNDTIVFLVFVKDGRFEGLDYSGKEFWVAFMQNFSNQGLEQKLFITGTKNTTVQVEMPLLGWSTSATVQANQVTTVNVPVTLAGVVTATEPADTISPTGIHISSAEEISVYGYSSIPQSTDAYLAIPRRTLGRKYVVTSPIGIYNPATAGTTLIQAPAEFIVIATENNTNIAIVCDVPTEKYAAGDTIRATLNQGQTFLVKAKVDYVAGIASNTYDLTGSRIFADQKVGLIGGSQCALIPGINSPDKCQSCDHLLEMISSPATWGTEFCALDFAFKPGEDIIRLVNADTVRVPVKFNGVSDTVPGLGFLDKKFNGTVSIQAEKPIQAFQMCTGSQCDVPTSSTDPFITTLIPEAQWGSYYTFTTAVSSGLSLNYINLVKKSKEGQVGFDGYRVPDNYFKQVPGTSYYVAQFGVAEGVHKVSGDSALYVTVYGFGSANSYGYPASGSFLKTISTPPVTITGTVKNIDCFGARTGRIDVEGHDGTPPYLFKWNDGQTGATRTGLDTGSYWVFVEDDFGYQDTAYFTVTQSDSIVVDIGAKNLNCFQSGDGELSVALSGGVGPYAFSWNDGSTSINRTGLVAGNYMAFLTDGLGCKVSKTITVKEPPQILVSLSYQAPLCYDDSNGSVHSQVQNGFKPLQYTWSNFPSVTSDSLTNIPGGKYYLTVTDTAGCVGKDSVVVTNPTKVLAQMSATGIKCFETSTGVAGVVASGGSGNYTYQWATSPVRTTAQITGLSKNWYRVTVSDGNCQAIDSVFVDSVSSPVVQINTSPASCSKPSGSATAIVTGGSGSYTYKYFTSPSVTASSVNKLLTGNYQVQVSDGNCSKIFPFTIGHIPGPVLYISTTDASCGADNGMARIDSLKASGTYSVKWNTSPAKLDSISVHNLKSGGYTVDITDSVCTVTSIFSIAKIPEIKVAGFTKKLPDCSKSNGRLTINLAGGNGPMQVTWLTTPPVNGQVLDNIPAGIYQVQIADGTCVLKTSVSLPSKNGPVIYSTVTQPTCDQSNGKISVNVTGGTGTYRYVWNGDTTLNTNVLSNLSAGRYILIVDDGTCTNSLDTLLAGTKKPVVSLQVYQASCGLDNGAIKAVLQNIKPGYTHYWNGVIGTDSINQLAPGKYVYKVFDGSCWGTDSTQLTAIPPVNAVVNNIDSSYCGLSTGSATLTVTGGSGVYNVTWLTTPVQYGLAANNISKGTYTVVFSDFNCSDSIQIQIPERVKPQLNPFIIPEHCNLNDGAINLQPVWATMPYSVNWTEQGVSGINPLQLDSGWYHYVFTDAYCSVADSIRVGYSDPPSVTLESSIPAHCGLKNGEARIKVQSPNGAYSAVWNSVPMQVGDTAIGLPYGDFQATVADQFCTVNINVHIDSIPRLILNSIRNVPADCGLPNGSVQLQVSGGKGTYLYSWSGQPANKDSIAVGLSEGWCTFEVKDDYCTLRDSALIIRIPKPSVSQLLTTPDWCKLSNGSARVTISGGTGSFTYQWKGRPNEKTDSLVNVPAGKDTLAVTDGTCVILVPVEISKGYPPGGQVKVNKLEACSKGNGEAEVINLNPPGAQIFWFANASQAKILSNRPAGIDSVKLSNAYCDTIISFTIGAVPELRLNALTAMDTCKAGVGQISWSATGGTPPYQFWFNGWPESGSTKSKLAVGNYHVEVRDIQNCSTSTLLQVDSLMLQLNSGRIIYLPLDASLSDDITLLATLPAGWLPSGWWVDGQLITSSSPAKFTAPAIEKPIEILLEATHDLGCVDSLYELIDLKANYNIYIPTSFTPDGDGINDFFFPVTQGITNVEGYIFDRWGEPVFAFHQASDKWDGTVSGRVCKSDTYNFKFIFTTFRGNKVTETGIVTLLR